MFNVPDCLRDPVNDVVNTYTRFYKVLEYCKDKFVRYCMYRCWRCLNIDLNATFVVLF
jgi:hypothetical protein